jgi:hypothetical protein
MSRRKDKRVFSRTACKTKQINVKPGEWRGGIRL